MGGVVDLVEWYVEMLKEDPSSGVFVSLAEALYRDRRWEEAVGVCRRGLEIHPGHLRARVVLGLALVELGRIGEGRVELDAARRELEKNADLYRVLARIASLDGDDIRARVLSDACDALEAASDGADGGRRMCAPVHPVEQAAQAGSAPSVPEEDLGAVKEERQDQPAVPVPRSRQVADLLSSWLRKCEAQADRAPERIEFFSEEDRLALRQLLKPATRST